MSPTLGTHSCSKIIVATMTRSMSKVQQARGQTANRGGAQGHCRYWTNVVTTATTIISSFLATWAFEDLGEKDGLLEEWSELVLLLGK